MYGSQIYRPWLVVIVNGEKQNFDITIKCSVVWMYIALKVFQVIFRYFGGRSRPYIGFMFCG
jgi:hypothetical protein